jgi:hypothetical protein
MNKQVDVTMSDYKEPLDQQVKRLEKQVMELQLMVSEMGNMILEFKNCLGTTRHKTNEQFTDLYGLIDHVGRHGKDYSYFSRQKIPIKHYV